jgi:uncharacterized membrane protein YkvA (DUF1232 family)
MGKTGGTLGKTGLLFRLLANLKLIFPLLKDYWRGEYRKIPLLTIIGILFTAFYLINPLDLIPDYLLGIGQIDDALILALCLFLLEKDLQDYRQWKIGQSSSGKKP